LNALQAEPLSWSERELRSGAALWLWGERVTLEVEHRPGKLKIEQLGERLLLADSLLHPARLRQRLRDFYTTETNRFLEDRLPVWEHQYGLKPVAVGTRNYRARWGACDLAGRLTFNWRLSMMPPWVGDYLICHELCHRKVFNHSKAFWEFLRGGFAQTREARVWLRTHGRSCL
jgi:hypothetical protein